MKGRMNKFFSILLVICMILSMMPVAALAATAGTLYLKPNSEWLVDGARFAAYFFGGTGDAWVSLTDSDGDGYYEGSVPSGHTSVIFCRMNGSTTTNVWDNKWNQTADLTIPTDGKNCWTLNSGDWSGGGAWSTYSGGGNTGGETGGSTTVEYYLFGFINGANYACEEDAQNMGSYKFSNGKLTTTFSSDSYVAVKTTGNASWYMTEGYDASATSVTLYSTSSGIAAPEKMFVPGGVKVTFTLKVNSNNTLTLSYTVDSGSCSHLSHDSNGVCNACGTTVGHSWSSGKCTGCGTTCGHISHSTAGKCTTCGSVVEHYYSNGTCSVCGKVCGHPSHSTSGKCTTCGTAVAHTYTNGVCSVCGLASGEESESGVKIHFVDTLGWQGVCAYAWEVSGTTNTEFSGWPGNIVNRDADGYYTVELDYEPASGKSLGILFHNFNGAQTADVSISYSMLKTSREIWVKPNGSTDADGKYTCSTATKESGLLISPEVNGNQVTFRYQNSSASKVYLAGSMNDWSTSANKMTKSGSTFTCTMTLEPGVYEYKFVVDGDWILDPGNGTVGGYGGNNIVVVPTEEPAPEGKITVKLHFYRESGDYAGWDAWMWCATKEGASYTLKDDPIYKGKVATITIDGATNSYLNYIIRKSDWSDQEFYDRSIDLTKIASGTVHFFLNSGSEGGSLILDNDVVFDARPSYANLDYESGRIWVKTPLPVSGHLTSMFSIVDASGKATDIRITGVTLDNNGYSLTLSRKVLLNEVGNLRVKCGTICSINTEGVFYSNTFANDYTYYGDDLGATWSKNSTTFKVWAPTATHVQVQRYKSGNCANDDWIETVDMTLGSKGVWSATVAGDLHGSYYTYLVHFADHKVEATDPYADSTGANSDRAMVLNLDATDPEGWENDVSPNKGMNYTDAIIYEMHVREMTIDESSGVKDAWKGKFLGMTQSGTNYQGRATGLDHLKELGITHVQLMPVYDLAWPDEYWLDGDTYTWGYNPKHFNVPEGSYSTNPHDGAVRVNEFKQMVQTFHSNGINVIMDVVYNHVDSAGDFCYNKIVPHYFTRFWSGEDWGSISNGSGVGNDFASQRSMGRNYIVDSIMHWVEEYHVDGFRFDLMGLIDTQTMNEIVNTVHAKYPNVIFYGEGWAPGDTAVGDYALATQGNAWMTPGVGFFNDGFRNAIAGDNGNSWGFANGAGDKADAIGSHFRASNGWSTSPTQTINYVSCHDNYTLMDKLCISRNGAYWEELVRMNNLSAAMYMLAQGVPLVYSGEEVLREKKNSDGYRDHNSGQSGDYVNKIRWSDLVNKDYAQVTDDYYAGLIEFRKNHAALRCPGGADAWGYTTYHKVNDQCILFYVNGYPNYECSDGIVIIYNGSANEQWVNLNNYGIPHGYWQACIHGNQAGTDALWGMNVNGTDGTVGVGGISTTVLVLGDLVHEESVYNSQASSCEHKWNNGTCSSCGRVCNHSGHNTNGLCATCGKNVGHTFLKGKCTVCGAADPDYVLEYYLFGYINGANYGCEENESNMGQYKFVNGKLTATFTSDSYVAVKTTDNADWFMAKTYISGTTGTLYNTSTGAAEKMLVPGGVEVTFTLIENANGTLTLSYVAATTECDHSYTSKVTTAATCTTAGVKTFTCSKCGDSYTESIPVTDHNYVGGSCSACGKADPDFVKPVLTLKYPTVSFEDEIIMNIFFAAENLGDITPDKMGLITFTSNVSDGTIENADAVIPGAELNAAAGFYCANTKGIAAKNLGDKVYFRAYVQLPDGSYVYSNMANYSPMKYAYSVLNGNYGNDMKALVAAMLNYGAAAQVYFNHNTDALVNADMTAAHKALVKAYSSDMIAPVVKADSAKAANFVNNGGFSRRYPSISFESAFSINYFFAPAYTVSGNITLYYWTTADYNKVSKLTTANATGSVVATAGSEYEAAVKGIAAKDLDGTIYVAAVYKSNGTTYGSGVLAYSIGAYCLDRITNGSASMQSFASATAVYGYYAKAYFAK